MPSADTSLGSIPEQVALVAKEKGIDKKGLIESIEAAIPMACPDDLPPITNAHPSAYPHPPQEDHP